MIELSWLPFAVPVLLKVTAVLAATSLLLLASRRASAAHRHAIAALGLGASLLLPLLALVVPRVEVPLLPGKAAPVRVGLVTEPSATLASETAREAALGATLRSVPIAARPVADRNGRAEAALEPAAAPEAPAPVVTSREARPHRADAAAPAPSSRPFPWGLLTLLAWALGAELALLRLLAGVGGALALSDRARTVREASWTSLMTELGSRLGLTRPVALRRGEVPVAMTTGVLSPVVLVPEESTGWPEERRRVVLLHELAHVKRRDCLVQLVGEVSAAVTWFHPLSWLLVRQLRDLAEDAADDLVLASGERPSVYAGQLLEIVRGLPAGAREPLPALAMGRPSGLEGRLRAILDPARRRLGLSPRRLRAASLALVAGAGVLAAVDPVARRAEAASTGSDRITLLIPVAVASRDASPVAWTPRTPQAVGAARVAPSVRTVPVARASRDVPALAPVAQAGPGVEWLTPVAAAPAGSWSVEGLAPMALTGLSAEGLAPMAPGKGTALVGRRRWKSEDSYSRGMELHNDERYEEAIEEFKRSIEDGEREEAASYNIACGYARLGKKDEAFEWLKKARQAGFDLESYLDGDDDLDSLRRDPRFRALREEAHASRSEKKKAQARSSVDRLEKLLAASPRNGSALDRVGRDLLSHHEYDGAARALLAAAETGQRPSTCLYNAACAYSLKGDKKAALETLRKAIEAGYDDPDHMRKDDDLDPIRDEKEYRALEEMADELSIPMNDMPWSRKLFPSTQRAHWREAANQARALTQKYPRLGRTWFGLGFVELKAERFDEARAAFQKAIDLGYRKGPATYNIACAYARAGDKDHAFEWLEKAEGAGFEVNNYLESDDDLDSLHGDPRYRSLVKKVRKAHHDDEED